MDERTEKRDGEGRPAQSNIRAFCRCDTQRVLAQHRIEKPRQEQEPGTRIQSRKGLFGKRKEPEDGEREV